MGIRRGEDYIRGLKDQREVWVEGEKAGDVTTHPAFRRGIRSIAALYDLQFDSSVQSEMTYRSPVTGEEVGLSFLIPRSVDEIIRRRRMLRHWSEACYGMLGRSPDFMNSVLIGLMEARGFLSRGDPRFGENVARYYEHCRENDLCLTHAIIDPQIDRSKDAASQADPYLYLGAVRETERGIVVRGAKMLATLGPYADEVLVYPNRPLGPGEGIYALAFALPVATSGLRLICREPIDRGQNRFDHPLASRFEEMDAVVVFNDVLVPWERVFLKGDVDLANRFRSDTPFVHFPVEQSVVRNLAKAEFVAGVAVCVAETVGITGFLHVQEKLGEMINIVELLRACLDASLIDCPTLSSGTVTARTEPLITARNLFPRLYPKMIETLQVLGAGGLLMIPTEKDLDGPIASDIEKYYQGSGVSARERVKLFKLAWDVAGEAFGQRQVQYERYFNGDPVRVIARHYLTYDKSRAIGMVKRFLSET